MQGGDLKISEGKKRITQVSQPNNPLNLLKRFLKGIMVIISFGFRKNIMGLRHWDRVV